MSYILDALNKSVKEQDPQSVPGVTTYSSSPTGNSRTVIYASIFALLILVNAVTIYFWMKDQAPAVDAVGALQTPSTLNSDAQTPAGISESESSLLVISPRTLSSGLTSLHNLPQSIQSKVRAMRFSSHIYSRHSDLRAVNIDGVSFSESEMVSNDLKLEQVTSDGIILNYLDMRFELSVINDWTDSNG